MMCNVLPYFWTIAHRLQLFYRKLCLTKLIIFQVFQVKWPEESINDKDIHQTLAGAKACCDWNFNTFQKPAA